MKLISRRSLLLSALMVPVVLAPEPKPMLPYPRRAPAIVNIFNRAKMPLGVDTAAFVAAMQRYVTEFIEPVWGIGAQLSWSEAPVAGAMNLVFVDDTEVEGAIAYHNFDPTIQKTPYGEISVVSSYMDATRDLSVPFSHELGEMLVNPGITMWSSVQPGIEEPNPTLRCYEIADPVERSYFMLDGFRMSNFVYPAYFEPWGDGQLDYLNVVKTPREVLKGGYQIVRVGNKISRILHDDQTDIVGGMCFRATALLRSHRH